MNQYLNLLKLNKKKLIGILLSYISGYIGGDLLLYSIRGWSSYEFSFKGAILGVCIALGYLMLKGEENR